MTTSNQRRCQRSFKGPFCNGQPSIERRFSKSNLARPLGSRQRFAIKCIVLYIPTIVVLLLSGSPITITRRITQIIISAVNRIFLRWSRSHISQEVLKTVVPQPSLTYFYATVTIASIFNGFIIVIATSNNTAPYPIFWYIVTFRTTMPMRSMKIAAKLNANAAAGLGVMSTQIIRGCDNNIAAITLTAPFGFNTWGTLNNNESIITGTSEVDKFTHRKGGSLPLNA